jgi:glycosyltransferase involved in cell wall biosynthesis
VIIGRRGWDNAEVFNILDQAPYETSPIIEVAGLASNAMRHIMANARALLMPSRAEGYGLPIVEALATGTPVIASDLDVFREIGGARMTYCRLDSTEAWLEAVQTHAAVDRKNSEAAMTQADNRAAWESYFRQVSRFMTEL